MIIDGHKVTLKFCTYCGSLYRHWDGIDKDYTYMRTLDSFSELRGLDNIIKTSTCQRCEDLDKVEIRKLVGVC
jgi:hypothetical protein